MDATLVLIDSDAELARARALVDRLWESDDPADIARLQAQARLIAAYEESKWPRRPPSTAELIRHLMDQHGLTRADMVPILGTLSRVSEILRGKKEPSMAIPRTGAVTGWPRYSTRPSLASVYALTKGALAAFTRGLAHDLGPRGITVNNVQPGPTVTDIVSAEVHEMLRPMMPIGRLGQDREVAALVAWLCREEAAFVNGASITADSGSKSASVVTATSTVLLVSPGWKVRVPDTSP